MNDLLPASHRARATGLLPQPTAHVANWQLVELLGEGTWSRVYRARPWPLAEDAPADYAIKLAKRESRIAKTAVRLLQNEARVGRSVADPHLVSILEFLADDEHTAVVMPYLDGVALHDVLDAGDDIPVPQALWIARQTAEALRALHAAGWMHRDVKPANIHVSPAGHVTLLDLGLARAICGSKHRAGQSELAGTLDYMAPENFHALGSPSAASDVYSLGIVLFELLAGRLPFMADDAESRIEAHLSAEIPDVRRYNPLVPVGASRLVKAMLAKQPARRPALDDLIADLLCLEVETFAARNLSRYHSRPGNF